LWEAVATVRIPTLIIWGVHLYVVRTNARSDEWPLFVIFIAQALEYLQQASLIGLFVFLPACPAPHPMTRRTVAPDGSDLAGPGMKTAPLVIGTDAMHFGDDEIQRDQVRKIRFAHLTYTKSGRPDPSQLGFTLLLRRKIHRDAELEFIATLPVLVDIIQFLNPPASNSAQPVTHYVSPTGH
jgi:hypothetical protein